MGRASIDEHAEASLSFDKPLVHQLLIALQDRKWIHPIFRRDSAHGRQRVAFLENAIEYHRDHTVAKLAVDRLTIIPLTVHQVFLLPLAGDTRALFFTLQVNLRVPRLLP